MKKSRIKLVSNALISASLRGLAVFAVFGMSLYAYAAISYPTQPGPVTGVVGLYVGKTVGTYNGNQGGYENVNALCAAVEADSHVCTPMEIVNTYNHDPSFTGTGSSVWVNNGAPAYYASVVNDCQGWTTAAPLYGNSVFGSVWSVNGYGSITTCDFQRAFACCK